MSIRRPASGWNIRRKPVHPGEMLREERRAVSADTALRLERYFGMSADFWLALQKDYDLQTARQSSGKQIARDIKPRRTAA